MSTDCIDFLQGLDVPHLRKTHTVTTQQKDKQNLSTHFISSARVFHGVTYDDGAVC